MQKIYVIAHDIRSSHNVGSLLRTAEGLAIDRVYLTGYTPYPKLFDDSRLPHIAEKLTKQIHKTALGAENYIEWMHHYDIFKLLADLKKDSFKICALEQSTASISLSEFSSSEPIALLIGREVEGIDDHLLKLCDYIIEIPMLGKKESFNVVQATAMTLYHLRFNANTSLAD